MGKFLDAWERFVRTRSESEVRNVMKRITGFTFVALLFTPILVLSVVFGSPPEWSNSPIGLASLAFAFWLGPKITRPMEARIEKVREELNAEWQVEQKARREAERDAEREILERQMPNAEIRREE